MRIALIVATVVGGTLIAYGILAAFFVAQRELDRADQRAQKAERLREGWRQEHRAAGSAEEREAINLKYQRLYQEAELLAPSYDNVDRLSGFESRRLLRQVLESTRSNLLWAGLGVLISTAASTASLVIS